MDFSILSDQMLAFFKWVNDDILAVPTVIIFFTIAFGMSLYTRFAQIRYFPRFIRLITKGARHKEQGNSISSLHALFTAMGTTIGMGNVVGPSLAVMVGGPGALFWLVMYIFLGSTIKLVEVTFAVQTREKTKDGKIIGGPMQYLKSVSNVLGTWYNVLIIILLIIWTGLQANTLANVWAIESVPHWATAIGLSLFTFIALSGGAQRVGIIASKLVPLMCGLYITFALFMLLRDPAALCNAISLVFQNVFQVKAVAGVSFFYMIKTALLRGVHMSEAGVGTSSIAHAMTDAKRPVDQGILAMCAMITDIVLCSLSGLIILVTGVWSQGIFRSTLIYEAFKFHAPAIGQYVLIFSISLFVLTTVMGNGFNGLQSFNAFTRYRFSKIYVLFTCVVVFFGCLMPVPLIWQMADTVMVMVAIPNLIGIIWLIVTKKDELKI